MNGKAQTIVTLAKSCLGWPYVFGAIGEICTPDSRYSRRRDDYPDIINKCQVLNKTTTTCDGCKYLGGRIFDCRGFTYWLLEQVGIKISSVGATTQYNTVKDWEQQGPISEMPNLVCCVFKKRDNKMSHTGMHIGNGNIIHCSKEVKTGTIRDKTWTHYAIPRGLYTQKEIKEAKSVIVMRNLKIGSTGEDVKELQEDLNKLGYNCGKADGNFGSKTALAVRQFQEKEGLKVDGIAGEQTQLLLKQKISGDNNQQQNTPSTDSENVEVSKDLLRKIKEELESIISTINKLLNT